MKLTLLFFVFMITGILQNISAQKYTVYESETFNVLLKSNQDGSQIVEISVTDATKSKWIKYQISEKEVEKPEPNSKRYCVSDGKNTLFCIDYFRYTDYILVENLENKETQTLYKRN